MRVEWPTFRFQQKTLPLGHSVDEICQVIGELFLFARMFVDTLLHTFSPELDIFLIAFEPVGKAFRDVCTEPLLQPGVKVLDYGTVWRTFGERAHSEVIPLVASLSFITDEGLPAICLDGQRAFGVTVALITKRTFQLSPHEAAHIAAGVFVN